MTIICYRDGIMAADTATWQGSTLISCRKKIKRLPSGTLVAGAGRTSSVIGYERWLESHDPFEAGFEPKCGDEGFSAMLVLQDGHVYSASETGYLEAIDDAFYAEGSAYELAIGAMAAGASAEQAVRICIGRSAHCGGDVQVEYLNRRKPLSDLARRAILDLS